jgi:hypothetical protein
MKLDVLDEDIQITSILRIPRVGTTCTSVACIHAMARLDSTRLLELSRGRPSPLGRWRTAQWAVDSSWSPLAERGPVVVVVVFLPLFLACLCRWTAARSVASICCASIASHRNVSRTCLSSSSSSPRRHHVIKLPPTSSPPYVAQLQYSTTTTGSWAVHRISHRKKKKEFDKKKNQVATVAVSKFHI